MANQDYLEASALGTYEALQLLVEVKSDEHSLLYRMSVLEAKVKALEEAKTGGYKPVTPPIKGGYKPSTDWLKKLQEDQLIKMLYYPTESIPKKYIDPLYKPKDSTAMRQDVIDGY